MQRLFVNRVVLLVLILLTSGVGYLAFRYFYGVAGDYPFTQEILLVFIGAVATVLITALLLNQQTDLELRKEGQVLLLDHKGNSYSALIEHIGEIIEKERMDEEALAELRVLNHKLTMFASAEVIRHFRDVLEHLDRATKDGRIADQERVNIMDSVAVLTYHMRRDLLGRIEGEDARAVLADILANAKDIED